MNGEERIVQDFLKPLTGGVPEALGLIDDCALVTPEPGLQLVFKTDAVVAGTHFFPDDAPADIAYKALAVNISDLIAKGARPRFWQLTLALPNKPAPDWLAALTSGFAAVQEACGCRLIGGDLVKTKGPLVISITAVGTVPTGRMVRRGGGRPGDIVLVSGTIGDAALGLAVRADDPACATWPLDGAARTFLRDRYLRPRLRTALIGPLLDDASAGMDVSDGLIVDFARLCRAAGVGGHIELARVPLSPAAAALVAAHAETITTVLTGGDDYEVLSAVPPDRLERFTAATQSAGCPVTVIGALTADASVCVVDAAGIPQDYGPGGYLHF